MLDKETLKSIVGERYRVRTMAIIFAEKLIGVNNANNTDADTNGLYNLLRWGYYAYYNVDSPYNSLGAAVVVYNVSLDDALYLANGHHQERTIFVDMSNKTLVSYKYFEWNESNKGLTIKHESSINIEAEDNIDFYSTICNSFKFQIPLFENLFWENIFDLNKRLNVKEKVYGAQRIDEMINESMDTSGRTGKSRYYRRGHLYGKSLPVWYKEG